MNTVVNFTRDGLTMKGTLIVKSGDHRCVFHQVLVNTEIPINGMIMIYTGNAAYGWLPESIMVGEIDVQAMPFESQSAIYDWVGRMYGGDFGSVNRLFAGIKPDYQKTGVPSPHVEAMLGILNRITVVGDSPTVVVQKRNWVHRLYHVRESSTLHYWLSEHKTQYGAALGLTAEEFAGQVVSASISEFSRWNGQFEVPKGIDISLDIMRAEMLSRGINADQYKRYFVLLNSPEANWPLELRNQVKKASESAGLSMELIRTNLMEWVRCN